MNKLNPLSIITRKVLSYCEIPEEIVETAKFLDETTCDSYIEHSVTPKLEQHKFSDDFTLDNWIIENWPEVEGDKILIHIDY